MPTVRVFTPRSTGIGVASGVLVAGTLGHFVSAAWGLAVLNGLAAGALALAGSICMRDGRFTFLMLANQRRRGVWTLAYGATAPMLLVHGAIIRAVDWADGRALSLLFGLTGFAAFVLGGVMATLAYLDGDEATADQRLHRVFLPPGERGPMPPLRVFTVRSTGIGIATSVLLAIALGQFLGVTWGLAALNGLVAGVLALALSTGLRDGLLDTTDNHQRRSGIWVLTYAVMMAPPVFAHYYIELRPVDEFGLAVLFSLTGFAAYVLGSIMATLVYFDGDTASADPRLHHVTSPPGERRRS